jgi:hypothetical protein
MIGMGKNMQGAVLYGPRDVRFEERETPTIIKPTDAIIRIAATCVCGSIEGSTAPLPSRYSLR